MSRLPAVPSLICAGAFLAWISAWVLRAPAREDKASPAFGLPPPAAVHAAPEPVANWALAEPQADSAKNPDSAAPLDATTVRRLPTPVARRAPARQTARFLASAMDAARTRPLDVLKALGRMQPSPERDAGLVHAVCQWADIEPAEALNWVRENPPGELREKLAAAATTAIAEHDPIAAADFVATEMNDGVARNHAAVAVIQRWAQTDPTGARQWVEQFPPSFTRDDALREIAVQERLIAGNR